MAKIVKENPTGIKFKCRYCGMTSRYYDKDIKSIKLVDPFMFPEERIEQYVECPACRQQHNISSTNDESIKWMIILIGFLTICFFSYSIFF